MEAVFHEIVRRCETGERVVLCTVVGAHGSTPQGKGARMLVLADGNCIGTLGGGCVEAEVRKRALELLSGNSSKLLEFRLDHDFGWDDGLICGGVLEIFAQVVDQAGAGTFAAALAAIRGKFPTTLRIAYEQNGVLRHYVEEVGPPPRLVIAGAGHIGQALAELAAKLDFAVSVIDDRADYVGPERFPLATQRIAGDIEAELRKFLIDAGTYIVIVTRGHRHDAQALHAVIDSPARYIGLIGSKSKVKLIYDDLAGRGVAPEKLGRVQSPIGYDIGAVTVPEIAVSIAAELIAVRRGKQAGPARAMRLSSDEVRKWLARDK